MPTITRDCYKCSLGQHSGVCETARGRKLARPCKNCGERFALYSSRSNRVRCPKCIRAVKRARLPKCGPEKPVQAKPLSLGEHRARLECEASPIAPLRRLLSYGLLKHAVGQRLGMCDRCGESCDVTSATLATIDVDEPEVNAEDYVSGITWRSKGRVDLLHCKGCGVAVRSPDAPSYVIEWLWGAELCDADTRRTAGLLAR